MLRRSLRASNSSAANLGVLGILDLDRSNSSTRRRARMGHRPLCDDALQPSTYASARKPSYFTSKKPVGMIERIRRSGIGQCSTSSANACLFRTRPAGTRVRLGAVSLYEAFQRVDLDLYLRNALELDVQISAKSVHEIRALAEQRENLVDVGGLDVVRARKASARTWRSGPPSSCSNWHGCRRSLANAGVGVNGWVGV